MIKHISAYLIISLFLFSTFICCYAESSPQTINPAKIYYLKTNDYEDSYAEIKIEKQLIKITGCFKNNSLEKIYLTNSDTVSTTLKVNSDGTFNATINPSVPVKPFDEINIKFKNGITWRYRIQYNNGWYIPDNGLSQNTERVYYNAKQADIKTILAYISDVNDKDTIESTLTEIKKLSDSITKNIDDPYKKMLAITDWVTKNIYYDKDSAENSVTISDICLRNVLKNKKTVCVGYANIFSALVAAQNIPCINVKGNCVCDELPYEKLNPKGFNHEWNAVYINERWITIDNAWNSSNVYKNGKYTSYVASQKYTDPTPLAFSLTHAAYTAEMRNYFAAIDYFKNPVTTITATSEASKESIPETSVTKSEISDVISFESTANGSTESLYSMYEDKGEGDGTNTLLFIAAVFVIAALIAALLVVLIRQKKDNSE